MERSRLCFKQQRATDVVVVERFCGNHSLACAVKCQRRLFAAPQRDIWCSCWVPFTFRTPPTSRDDSPLCSALEGLTTLQQASRRLQGVEPEFGALLQCLEYLKYEPPMARMGSVDGTWLCFRQVACPSAYMSGCHVICMLVHTWYERVALFYRVNAALNMRDELTRELLFYALLQERVQIVQEEATEET